MLFPVFCVIPLSFIFISLITFLLEKFLRMKSKKDSNLKVNYSGLESTSDICMIIGVFLFFMVVGMFPPV